MSSVDDLKKVYKHRDMDFGLRLTAVIRLDALHAVGGIYQAVYYDGSGYDGFEARHVYITADQFLNHWVEVKDEEH